VYMGTTLNAQAVIQAARRHDTDIVLIPAGLAGEPGFNAQEDWAAATAMAMAAGETVECGADRFRYWRERIRTDGILRLFETAPHAAKLRDAGLGDDIAYCAQIDVTTAVPQAVAHAGPGLVVRNAQPIA
jgi:phosphosulfolactate phosphohydrolase-like enzyme